MHLYYSAHAERSVYLPAYSVPIICLDQPHRSRQWTCCATIRICTILDYEICRRAYTYLVPNHPPPNILSDAYGILTPQNPAGRLGSA